MVEASVRNLVRIIWRYELLLLESEASSSESEKGSSAGLAGDSSSELWPLGAAAFAALPLALRTPCGTTASASCVAACSRLSISCGKTFRDVVNERCVRCCSTVLLLEWQHGRPQC